MRKSFLLQLILLAGFLSFGITSSLHANVFESLIRGISKTPNGALPKTIRGSEDISKRLAKNKNVETVAAKEMGDLAKLKNARAVGKMIRSYSPDLPPSLIKQVETLSPAELPSAIILGKGTKQLRSVVGDASTTARFIREGGTDLVAATGIRGDLVVEDAIRLDALLRTGKLPVPKGYQTPTLESFGKCFLDGTDATWNFYTKSVRPYWKEWAAGGSLVIFFAKPELFYDAAGALTERGTEVLIDLGGEALAAVLRGVQKGSEKAAEEIVDVVKKSYLPTKKSIPNYLGLAFVLLLVSLLFKRTRKFLLFPFRWLNTG